MLDARCVKCNKLLLRCDAVLNTAVYVKCPRCRAVNEISGESGETVVKEQE